MRRPFLLLLPAIHALGGRTGDLSAEIAAAVARGERLDPEVLDRLGEAAAAAVPRIAALLADPDPDLRRQAAGALARIGPAAAEALPALRPLLTDPGEEVRIAARAALHRIRAR